MPKQLKLHIVDFGNCDQLNDGTQVWQGICQHFNMFDKDGKLSSKPCKSPLYMPRHIASDEMIRAHDGQELDMTVEDILECINDGHSEQWIDYDKTDFIEGMYEWTYLCLTDRAVYELLGTIPPPKRLIDIYG